MAGKSGRWHRWLLDIRRGGDPRAREEDLTGFLYPVRDKVLDKGRLVPGETLLDMGAGDGLIAFGALERLGPSGQVIFCDISGALLDHCRKAAEAEGHLERCRFVLAAVLPMLPGTPERRSLDYARHGTTDLLAVLNIANGTVISNLSAQHRAIQFRDFLDQIDQAVESAWECTYLRQPLHPQGRTTACGRLQMALLAEAQMGLRLCGLKLGAWSGCLMRGSRARLRGLQS